MHQSTLLDGLPGAPFPDDAPETQLRYYQVEAVAELLAPPPDVWRDLLVLPTGAGKTICFADLVAKALAAATTAERGGAALVLAHREELIDQAAERIRQYAPHLRVEVEREKFRADRETRKPGVSTVVVASVASLKGKRLDEFGFDAFDLVVVDEAHHATSASYTAIFERFGCFSERQRTRLVGVTATPNRTDNEGLEAVFQRIAYQISIKTLVDQTWLCRLLAERIETQTSLVGIETRDGDFNAKQVAERVDNPERNRLIAATVAGRVGDRPTIVFAASVEHAHNLTEAFEAEGLVAATLWGEMAHDLRKETIEGFRAGRIQVLTNFGIATEGFDIPAISCVVLARPSKSMLLLTQMVGRGMRPWPGKENLLVLDVVDATGGGKKLATTASLAGLPESFDPAGGDVFALKDGYDEVVSEFPYLAHAITDPDKLRMALDALRDGKGGIPIQLLGEIEYSDVVVENSAYAWVENGSAYAIKYRNKDRYTGEVAEELWTVHEDLLGKWHVVAEKHVPTKIHLYDSAAAAFATAERSLRYFYGDGVDKLMRRDAPWRNGAPSETQIHWLEKKKVFPRGTVPSTLTKGMASMLLDRAFAKGPRKAGKRR